MTVSMVHPFSRDRARFLALMLDLELNRDMRDTQARHLAPDSLQHFGMRGQLRHYGVAAHRNQSAGHRPDVQIVDRGYAGDIERPALDLGHGDVARNAPACRSIWSTRVVLP